MPKPSTVTDIDGALQAAEAQALAGQQAAAEPVVPSQQPAQVVPQQQPAQQVSANPFVEAARQRGFDLPENATEDDFWNSVEALAERNELVAKHLGEEFDEQQLQSVIDGSNRYQQIAPQLTDYEKWLQSQQQQPAAPQQPQPAFPQLEQPNADYYRLASFDAATGRYKPIVAAEPACVAAADAINKYERSLTERGRQLLANPQAMMQPFVEPLQKEIAELKSQLAQVQGGSQSEREWQSFYQQYGKDLSSFDVNTGAWKPTKAGEIFGAKVEEYVKRGISEKDARELALDYARVAAPSVALGNGQDPTQQQAAQPAKRKFFPRPTQPTDVAGNVAGTVHVPMNDQPGDLSLDAIMERSAQAARAAR